MRLKTEELEKSDLFLRGVARPTQYVPSSAIPVVSLGENYFGKRILIAIFDPLPWLKLLLY